MKKMNKIFTLLIFGIISTSYILLLEISGTEILYKSRYHAKLCKYVVDTKDKALYFLFFLPEGSSHTADGKPVDVYLSTAIFELNGKIYRLSFQPALSDHHDPIEILELDALRKCRSGIKLQETK